MTQYVDNTLFTSLIHNIQTDVKSIAKDLSKNSDLSKYATKEDLNNIKKSSEANETAISTNTLDISVLKTSVSANKEAISNETTRAKTVEQANTDAINANKSAIDILNGNSTTEGSVKKAIKDLIGSAPEALDTLGEIATQLQNDESAATAITNTLTEETIRAKAAEQANTKAINDEVTRAKAAEKTNSDAIANLDSTKLNKSDYKPYDDTQIKKDIATNTTNITSNTKSITTNTSDIATLKSKEPLYVKLTITGEDANISGVYNFTSDVSKTDIMAAISDGRECYAKVALGDMTGICPINMIQENYLFASYSLILNAGTTDESICNIMIRFSEENTGTIRILEYFPSQIDTNTSDIAKLRASVSTNTTNITANTTAIATKEDKKSISNVTATAGIIVTLTPNVFTNITMPDAGGAVTISITAPANSEHVVDYDGSITIGKTVPTITWDSKLVWLSDTPTLTASKRYEYSIRFDSSKYYMIMI